MTTESQPFLDMAADIEKNDAAKFSGAFVIMSPDGNIVSGLLLDAKKDGAAFWSVVNAKVEIATIEFKEGHKAPGQFGGGRMR